MSQGLVGVSKTTLERLRQRITTGNLRVPLTRSALVADGVREQLEVIVAILGGHSREATLSILDAVLAEREAECRPAPELVWTGPEASHSVARDTQVVLRHLFESAERRVVLAGYSFRNATEVLGPLHASMASRNVDAYFFVRVDQVEAAVQASEQHGQKALRAFLQESWPFGAPYPRVYCDRRALTPGPPWSSLHAKCVAVDGERAFISSANFTSRGQERNIEVGILLHDSVVASQLERQWLGLIDADLVLEGRTPSE